MIIHMNTCIVRFNFENQFIHPVPKGSELIFPAPFRGGVNRENHLAIEVNMRTVKKLNSECKNESK